MGERVWLVSYEQYGSGTKSHVFANKQLAIAYSDSLWRLRCVVPKIKELVLEG